MAFIKNITHKDIQLRSFEGYSFTILPGTSWIWDKAGKHLLEKIYVERPKNFPKIDIYGNPNGNGVNPLQAGTLREWVKEGKHLCEVKRFKVNFSQIPRKQLIPLARERGVENDLIVKWLSDDTIDISEITAAINALPIPEEIRYPKELDEESETKANDSSKETTT